MEDVIEDIGSISDKFLYKEVVGRPRNWRKAVVEEEIHFKKINSIEDLFDEIRLKDELDIKKVDLLISLFIGSINDIDRVKEGLPKTTLDRVKQKIQLFDGDQTRFVYQKPSKKKIRIQGLSGTGKTELLLHKLKELYTSKPNSKIFFTCHNKILADNLRKRIPSFFNFMKVEQQIEWESRLWCANAWGTNSEPNSGAYRYICAKYQIPYYGWSHQMSFSKACGLACQDLRVKYKTKIPPAFNYMLIDESQDFDVNFLELCDLVTEDNIYIAGDIFQSIFDAQISSTIEPDFLLGKCYRTDPKTLMFAHALGMGLFEETKLRWLETKEWIDCGYLVNIDEERQFHLSREPLRRFEDIEEEFESIEIVRVQHDAKYEDSVLKILHEIIDQNPTVKPDDIGIIFLDYGNETYRLADVLEVKIKLSLNWDVNKAYETKIKIPETILISNRNNVKGLEFPFVICISHKITKDPSYRNSLYTMLTRSFIKSFFVIEATKESGLTNKMLSGLKQILQEKEMVIKEPSPIEKNSIRTRFEGTLKTISHYDTMLKIFKNLGIEEKFHDKLLKMTHDFEMVDSDEETLMDFVKHNKKFLKL